MQVIRNAVRGLWGREATEDITCFWVA